MGQAVLFKKQRKPGKSNHSCTFDLLQADAHELCMKHACQAAIKYQQAFQMMLDTCMLEASLQSLGLHAPSTNRLCGRQKGPSMMTRYARSYSLQKGPSLEDSVE